MERMINKKDTSLEVSRGEDGLGEVSEEEYSTLNWFGGGNVGADGIENEVDDGISEERNDETEKSIEDGVFGIGDFFVVAAGNDVTKSAPD